MAANYDPIHIGRYFDEYGYKEWERLEAAPSRQVNFHIHRLYLQQYINAGDNVLEVGAGPGRFTIELGKLGTRVVVGDISPEQLKLNVEKVGEAGYEHCVVAREVLDVVDLSRFPPQSFDAVVCYGGPLSYVFDQADDAVEQLLAVTKPGGHLLISVMSVLGTVQMLLSGVLADVRQYGLDAMQRVIATGNHVGELSQGHHCHMYRWPELEALLRRHSCEIVLASASNCLSTGNNDVLEDLVNDPETWAAILQWEIEFCKEPGALDGGTHIIAVVRRT